jgi:hypothetical protein
MQAPRWVGANLASGARTVIFFLAAAVVQLTGSVFIWHMIEWFSTACCLYGHVQKVKGAPVLVLHAPRRRPAPRSLRPCSLGRRPASRVGFRGEIHGLPGGGAKGEEAHHHHFSSSTSRVQRCRAGGGGGGGRRAAPCKSSGRKRQGPARYNEQICLCASNHRIVSKKGRK